MAGAQDDASAPGPEQGQAELGVCDVGLSGVPGLPEHLSREERRRRTEAAILHAAREQFAELGFDRTTIRSVAAQACVDPALVMQHHGSKEGLFAAAARWTDEHSSMLTATSDNLARAAVDDVLAKFEGAGREGAVALIRNCLTHPGAGRVMRDDVMADRIDAVAAAIDSEDRDLRAALFGAVMMGVTMSRYVMEVEPLASAGGDELRRVLEPVLRAMLGQPPVPPGACAGPG